MYQLAGPVHLQRFQHRVALSNHVGINSIGTAIEFLVVQQDVATKLPMHRLSSHVLSVGNVPLWILMSNNTTARLPGAALNVKVNATKGRDAKGVAPLVV